MNMSSYVFTDHAYGEHERQVLDLYIPKETAHKNGLILFIHGGGWIAGNKEDYSAEAKRWASDGYITASISYHYLSETTHMDVLTDDISAALAEIRTLAASKGFDLTKCLLTGGSAGGHLSLLYAYKEGKTAPIAPVAVVSFCGPTDLRDEGFIIGNRLGIEEFMAQLLSWLCGETVDLGALEHTKDALYAYSPLKYAASAVPTAFGHGQRDSIVPFANAVGLNAELDKLGVEHDFVIYPSSDHDLAADPESAERMQELFRKYAEKYIG